MQIEDCRDDDTETRIGAGPLVHDLTKDGFVLGVVTDRVLRVRVHQLLLEAGGAGLLALAPPPPVVVAVAQQAHHEVLGGRGHARGAAPPWRGRGRGRRGEVGRPAAAGWCAPLLLRLLPGGDEAVVVIPSRKRDELPAPLGDEERRRSGGRRRPRGGGRDGGSEGGGRSDDDARDCE